MARKISAKLPSTVMHVCRKRVKLKFCKKVFFLGPLKRIVSGFITHFRARMSYTEQKYITAKYFRRSFIKRSNQMLWYLYTVQGASGIDARFLKQIKTFIKSLKIITA